jgi:hypothetical protein
MWKFHFANLCIVLFLAALLAARHTTSVREVNENGYMLAHSGEQSNHADSVFERSWTDTFPGISIIDYLNGFWQRAMIMRQWILEYETANWGKVHAKSGAEDDLVEARFHVANAEVFGVALVKKQRAKAELDRADRYLQKALPLVAQDMMPVVKAIEKELTDAKADLETADPDAEATDEQIKTDLDWAIASLHSEGL